MNRISFVLGAALALVPSGCGSGSAGDCAISDHSSPLKAVASDAGKFQIQLRTSPQPPMRGINCAQYVVTDAQGRPQDGLTITVKPYMPAMGHGLSVNPTVTGQGHGIYLLTQLYLPMPGTYALKTTLADGAGVTDNAAPSFDLQ
jgi:hypothetical protein